MKYMVIWLPDAQDQLAELWMNATDRNAVTQATHQIDQILAQDPSMAGEDFYGDRLLIVPPLQIVFAIRPEDLIVEVQLVW